MAAKDCSNKRDCACTSPGCPRHGKCCDCLAYHLSSKQLPGCCFSPDVEKTYDRSFARFCEVNGS